MKSRCRLLLTYKMIDICHDEFLCDPIMRDVVSSDVDTNRGSMPVPRVSNL